MFNSYRYRVRLRRRSAQEIRPVKADKFIFLYFPSYWFKNAVIHHKILVTYRSGKPALLAKCISGITIQAELNFCYAKRWEAFSQKRNIYRMKYEVIYSLS